MSGHGAPGGLVAPGAGAGLRLAVISALWHRTIMDGLRGGAERALEHMGVTDVLRVQVPGSFELPVAAARLADSVDAVVALGVVLRGETPHFDYVCLGATTGLAEVSAGTGTPVGFGLLTCDTEDQALARAGLAGSKEDKGYEAAEAAAATVLALRAAEVPVG